MKMTENDILKTALYDKFVALEATMGLDGGWEMPLSFSGAMSEAEETHRRGGVFDVSHVGRIRIRGYEGVDLLERLCTSDVVHQEDDTAQYTLLCNENGGIIDHCMALRMDNWWLITTSPENRLKVLEHLQTNAGNLDVKVDDQTSKTSMLCITGPSVQEILNKVLPIPVSDLGAGAVKAGSLLMARYIAMRTNYLGLWTLEIVLPNLFTGQAWRFITDKAGENALKPAGQTTRDILRIEAGHCRFGHEINETIDPFTAGLEGAVNFEHNFMGREALEKLRTKTPARKRAGLVLSPPANDSMPAIPRLGATVALGDGGQVGSVTSGTYSTTLEKTIAMAYVRSDTAEIGNELAVEIEGAIHPAKVVDLPFVK